MGNYLLSNELFERSLSRNGFESISAFARASGVHRNTINSYITGRVSVFTSAFLQMTSYLKVDPLEMLTFTSDSRELFRLKSLLHAALKDYPEICAVLFGSRLTGRASQFSDWDIGISGTGSVRIGKEFYKIRNRIEDSTENFPYMLDIVNLGEAPVSFIQKLPSTPMLLLGNREAYHYLCGRIDGAKALTESSAVA